MTKITCTRTLDWDMGHRVYGHENLCKHVHGHRFSASVEASAPQLDGVGCVVDFSLLKKLVGGWIDANWDHAFCVWDRDPLKDLLARAPGRGGVVGQ